MDRETDPSYSLRVQVEDGGTTPRSVETTYTIVVDDFNDNSPQFASNQTTNIVVNENQAPGEVLLAIRATDADTGMYVIEQHYLAAAHVNCFNRWSHA